MWSLIKNAMVNLKGHKLRLIVAFIWIIIGISSVIFVSSLGNALRNEIEKSFTQVAPNTAIIYFESDVQQDIGNTSNDLLLQAAELYKPFTETDLNLLALTDGILKITPKKEGVNSGMGFDNNEISYLNASFLSKNSGCDVSPFKKNTKFKLLKGRTLTAYDSNRNTIVLSNTTAEDLFGDEPALGKGITIQGKNYEIVGILDSDFKYDKNEKIFKKISEFEPKTPSFVSEDIYNIITGKNLTSNTINSIEVKVSDAKQLKTIMPKLTEKLQSLHSNIPGVYKVKDRTSIQKSIENITGSVDKFVSVMVIVSMIVGGVGIMNIMYVSVMERVKEIGIRRALGAKPSAILFQFLIESVFITSVGGVMGIFAGFGITIYSGNFMPFRPIPDVNSLIYAFIATFLTGVIFGIVPAIKASGVDPIKIIYK